MQSFSQRKKDPPSGRSILPKPTKIKNMEEIKDRILSLWNQGIPLWQIEESLQIKITINRGNINEAITSKDYEIQQLLID
jgi:hypothetical protein